MEPVLSQSRGFSGTISLQLTDLIQMICIYRSDITIGVRSGRRSGRIYVKAGEICHVKTEVLEGEPALLQLLQWKDGQFELLPFQYAGVHTVNKSWEYLILEAIRVRDEEKSKHTTESPWLPMEGGCPTLEGTAEPEKDESELRSQLEAVLAPRDGTAGAGAVAACMGDFEPGGGNGAGSNYEFVRLPGLEESVMEDERPADKAGTIPRRPSPEEGGREEHPFQLDVMPEARLGAPMEYRDFYRMEKEPFSNRTPPEWLFESQSHGAAWNRLMDGFLSLEPALLVVGDKGIGKTTLCHRLVSLLEERPDASYVYVSACAGNSSRLMWTGRRGGDGDNSLTYVTGLRNDPTAILTAFANHMNIGVDHQESITERICRHFNETGSSEPLYMVIDDATELFLSSFERLNTLLDYSPDGLHPIKLILFAPHLFSSGPTYSSTYRLIENYAAILFLDPLSADETREYIHFRLSKSKAPGVPIFTEEAFDRIHAKSCGSPGIINSVCRSSLSLGAQRGLTIIDSSIVTQALSTGRETAMCNGSGAYKVFERAEPPKALPGAHLSALPSLALSLAPSLALSPSPSVSALSPETISDNQSSNGGSSSLAHTFKKLLSKGKNRGGRNAYITLAGALVVLLLLASLLKLQTP